MLVLQVSQTSDLGNNCDRSPLKVGIYEEPTDQLQEQRTMSAQDDRRVVLDLLMSPMSPNRVSAHFRNVHGKQLSAWKIKHMLLAQEECIAALNARFDQVASGRVSLKQIDEAFKGRNISILVLIDVVTGYIFHLQWLERRTKDVIIEQLCPLHPLLQNVTLVLTDGAPYFPAVVKEVCPNVGHQICLLHVMRGLYPHLSSYKTEYTERLRSFQDIQQAVKRKEASIIVR